MKTAVVLGGAECVWDDYERALQKLGGFDVTLAVNDMIKDFQGHLDYAVSLHPGNKLEGWLAEREAKGLNRPTHIIAHNKSSPSATRVVDYRFGGMSISGSSGLYAVKVALDDGAKKIVLCGVPMDASKYYYGRPSWANSDQYFPAWKTHYEIYGAYTRSYSGRTRKLLGEPTLEWFNA